MLHHLRILASTTAMCVVLGGQASAADIEESIDVTKPAVSGINGKLDIGYNYLDFSGLPGHLDAPYAIGTISLPVGHQFGLQFDAGGTRVSASALPGSITLGGGAVHAFWRNPDHALLGVYAHYVDLSAGGGVSADMWRLGAEAEIYLDRFSIEGFAGADLINAPVGNLSFFNGDLYAAYYATDNIRVHGAVLHQFNNTLGRVGGEAILPFASNNVSLYADGTFGSGVTSVRGGLKFYFGEAGKSLIARHREDDPKTRLLDFFGFDVNLTPPAVTGCPPGTIDDGDGNCIPIRVTGQ